MEITAEAKKRLSSLIEERDSPLAPLAAKIGVSQSTLWNFVYGGTKNFSKLHRLATELNVSLDWVLQGDRAAATPEQTQTPSRLSEPDPAPTFKYPAPTILILGRPLGVGDAFSMQRQEKIGTAERHPAQKNMEGAFAIYVVGEEMAPRYRPGELAYSVALKTPAKGQDCIVELTNGESYLREFVAHKGGEIHCRKLNPDKKISWTTDEIKALHAVVGRG